MEAAWKQGEEGRKKNVDYIPVFFQKDDRSYKMELNKDRQK